MRSFRIGMMLVLTMAIIGSGSIGSIDAWAAKPLGTVFTYQGRLDSEGEPANGSFAMGFQLFDGSGPAALQLGPDVDLNPVEVVDGLFTVQLDFGGNEFMGDRVWLQIHVAPSKKPSAVESLYPRQEITPSPYAIYAATGPGYTGVLPVTVDNEARTIALNAATDTGDLLTWDGNNWVAQPPAVQHFEIDEDNRQPFLAVNFIIAIQGVFPSRNSIHDPTIGEITMFGGSFAPRFWEFCNGQLLPISQNEVVYAILGTTFGGDGRTTVALPDLRGRVPVHSGLDQGPGLSNYNPGQKGGSERIIISR